MYLQEIKISMFWQGDLHVTKIMDKKMILLTPTWCIPRNLRPFRKYCMDECGGVGELENIFWSISSSKNVGIFPFWRILRPVNTDLSVVNYNSVDWVNTYSILTKYFTHCEVVLCNVIFQSFFKVFTVYFREDKSKKFFPGTT